MILSLLARISDDKNFFVDVLFAIYKCRERFGVAPQLNFVGAIENRGIYDALIRLTSFLQLTGRVFFTGRSVRYDEMPLEWLNGYFLNYSVGSFLGYSTIESVSRGLKVISYNVVPEYSDAIDGHERWQCRNVEELVQLLGELCGDNGKVEQQILKGNRLVANDHYLSSADVARLSTLL